MTEDKAAAALAEIKNRVAAVLQNSPSPPPASASRIDFAASMTAGSSRAIDTAPARSSKHTSVPLDAEPVAGAPAAVTSSMSAQLHSHAAADRGLATLLAGQHGEEQEAAACSAADVSEDSSCAAITTSTVSASHNQPNTVSEIHAEQPQAGRLVDEARKGHDSSLQISDMHASGAAGSQISQTVTELQLESPVAAIQHVGLGSVHAPGSADSPDRLPAGEAANAVTSPSPPATPQTDCSDAEADAAFSSPAREQPDTLQRMQPLAPATAAVSLPAQQPPPDMPVQDQGIILAADSTAAAAEQRLSSSRAPEMPACLPASSSNVRGLLSAVGRHDIQLWMLAVPCGPQQQDMQAELDTPRTVVVHGDFGTLQGSDLKNLQGPRPRPRAAQAFDSPAPSLHASSNKHSPQAAPQLSQADPAAAMPLQQAGYDHVPVQPSWVHDQRHDSWQQAHAWQAVRSSTAVQSQGSTQPARAAPVSQPSSTPGTRTSQYMPFRNHLERHNAFSPLGQAQMQHAGHAGNKQQASHALALLSSLLDLQYTTGMACCILCHLSVTVDLCMGSHLQRARSTR